MKLSNLFIFFFLLFTIPGQAQDSTSDDKFVKKDFLSLLSTKSYKAALTTAKKVSSSINMKLDLRGLAENKESGLSFSKEECKEEDIEHPAYYARDREDDGVYQHKIF